MNRRSFLASVSALAAVGTAHAHEAGVQHEDAHVHTGAFEVPLRDGVVEVHPRENRLVVRGAQTVHIGADAEKPAFDGVRGVVAEPSGGFFVLDRGNSRVQHFDGRGRLLATERAQDVSAIAWSPKGLVKAEAVHRRVVTGDGRSIWLEGTPKHLAALSDGRLAVVTFEGELLVVGADGVAKSLARGLRVPTGVAVDAFDRIAVSDAADLGVHVFDGSSRTHIATDDARGIPVQPMGVVARPDGFRAWTA